MEIITDLPIEDAKPSEPGALVAQLEEAFAALFDRNDDGSYLSSFVSDSGEIRIEDICKAPKVTEITSNQDTIKNAIYNSKNLRVCSESTVKSALAKPEQNTLILRDIASTTPSGEVLAIFTNAVCADGSPCPAAQSVRSDMNDTWFVIFPSEAEAKAALDAVRHCKFQDKPVRARLKTEATHKSFYSAPNSASGVAGKGTGTYSPRNPASGTPSPVARSPQGAPQGAFFGSYPVPPPQYAAGPPSAGQPQPMLGPDGKPFFPAQPTLGVYGAGPQGPGFIDGQQGGYGFHNRRYNPRNPNGFTNPGGFNNNRSPTGGYRNNGGRGGGGRQHGYVQQVPLQMRPSQPAPMPMPMIPVPPPVQSGSAEGSGGGEGTPRSGAGSTTVDGSSPDTAVAPNAPAKTDGQAVPDAPVAPGPPMPPPLGVTIPGQVPGQKGAFVSFGQPGSPAFLANYPFGTVPMAFPGFATAAGLPPSMSPVHYGGQMSPMFFPMGVGSPVHHMAPHPGFPHQQPPQQMQPHLQHQQQPHGYAPRGQPHAGGEVAGGGWHPQQRHNGGGYKAGRGYQQGNNAPPGPPGERGSPRTSSSGHSNQGATKENAISADQPSPVSEAAANSAEVGEKKSVGQDKNGTGGNKGNRDRKNSYGDKNGAEREPPARATVDGAESSASAGNRRNVSSAQSEGASRKAGSSSSSNNNDSSGKKNSDRTGEGRSGGDKRKSGREKDGREKGGRGDKDKKDAASAAPPKRAAFNMEADFPTLVEPDPTDRSVSGTTAAPKMATFDYASAARKASQPAALPAPAPTAAPASTAIVDKVAAKSQKSRKTEKTPSSEDVAKETSSAAAATTPALSAPAPTPASAPDKESPAVVEAAPVAKPAPVPAQEPQVESFTFGSVVAPVVNNTDKAGMHFGSSSSRSGGSAAAADGTHAGAQQAPVVSSATKSEQPVTSAGASAGSSEAVEVAKPTAAWGTKKSFADILQKTDKA